MRGRPAAEVADFPRSSSYFPKEGLRRWVDGCFDTSESLRKARLSDLRVSILYIQWYELAKWSEFVPTTRTPRKTRKGLLHVVWWINSQECTSRYAKTYKPKMHLKVRTDRALKKRRSLELSDAALLVLICESADFEAYFNLLQE